MTNEKTNIQTASDQAVFALTLMQARQTILPKRLIDPAPDALELQQILQAAAQAPDHGQILPWRFVQVPMSERAHLADVFAAALLRRDAKALPAQIDQAREKAFRSPLLLLLVVDAARGDQNIDLNERLISAGCAVQNMLLMATALGFGSALTSGKALKDDGLRALFSLSEQDHAVCFISIGTVKASKPLRQRPDSTSFFSHLKK